MPVDLASLENSVKCVLKWTLEKGNDFLYGGFISGQIGDKNQDKSVHRVVHLSLASMSNVSITIIDFSKQVGPTHDLAQHDLPVLWFEFDNTRPCIKKKKPTPINLNMLSS